MTYFFRDFMGGHIIEITANSYTEALEEARQILTSPRLLSTKN